MAFRHSWLRLLTEKMIRSADNSDEEEVTCLVFQILREYGLQPDPDATDADLKNIEASYSERGGCFDVLLNDEGRIVGTVALFAMSENTCELRKMYLQQSERGKGLGKVLLEHALARAVGLGFTRVVLETASALKEATRLYERYGFDPYEPKHLSKRCDRAFVKNLPNNSD